MKYADVLNGDEDFNIMICINGGSLASLGSPFVAFQNNNCSHPVRGLPNLALGVCYRTGMK